MDYISSQSTGDGHLAITVIFKIGTDPNAALQLTRNRVRRTRCLDCALEVQL